MEARVLQPPNVEAEHFLRQFHAENQRSGVESRLAGWTQDPVLTEEELAYGARVAWRNSIRCIGRLPWTALQLRDRRHVSRPAEVFAELIAHLNLAFAGGRVRPVISVFGPGVRIVNDQLLRYAGYLQPDGTVLVTPRTWL
ncbi:hypothetical protein GCM10008955_13700 [Deinococcus malanensis]|uniref:Nitric oxide synthase (NOS) domain-containing protein n=1 Tax=Deinococcus malanensis TaxID=1706855 RepID=A0ABQ2ETS0_9DEIO|nr:hypothetical protein GCM10008955_13700 [Deinococcus malanensis]